MNSRPFFRETRISPDDMTIEQIDAHIVRLFGGKALFCWHIFRLSYSIKSCFFGVQRVGDYTLEIIARRDVNDQVTIKVRSATPFPR